jgi:hypothetical protein
MSTTAQTNPPLTSPSCDYKSNRKLLFMRPAYSQEKPIILIQFMFVPSPSSVSRDMGLWIIPWFPTAAHKPQSWHAARNGDWVQAREVRSGTLPALSPQQQTQCTGFQVINLPV